MTQLLERAFIEASKLPDAEQGSFASLLLAELDSERRWAQAFASTQNQLAALADEALREFEREREINPANSAVYDRLGDVYTRSGNYQEAQQAPNAIVEIAIGFDPLAAARGYRVLLLAPSPPHLIQGLWAAAFGADGGFSGEHRDSLRARAPR